MHNAKAGDDRMPTSMLIADLDGTLLHDAQVFEDRFITQRSNWTDASSRRY